MSYYHIAKLAVNNHHNTINIFDLATTDDRNFDGYCVDMQKAFQEFVKAILKNSRTTEKDGFEAWKNYLIKQGWKRGKEYSAENKTHPALVSDLEDVKDDVNIHLFSSLYFLTESMAYLIS